MARAAVAAPCSFLLELGCDQYTGDSFCRTGYRKWLACCTLGFEKKNERLTWYISWWDQLVTSLLWARELFFGHLLEIAKRHTEIDNQEALAWLTISS